MAKKATLCGPADDYQNNHDFYFFVKKTNLKGSKLYLQYLLSNYLII